LPTDESASPITEEMTMSDEDFPQMSFKDLQLEIDCLEASELVTVERNDVNGYVSFRFYDTAGDLAGKLTFDEIEDDMVGRTKAVIDHLASTEHTVLYQDEIESVWDRYDPSAVPGSSV
jgi:DNA-directed RNA polymerase subunit H (RpoH/RPB5)